MSSAPTCPHAEQREENDPFQQEHSLSEFGLNSDEQFRCPRMFRNLTYDNAAQEMPNVRVPERIPSRPPPTNWEDFSIQDEEYLDCFMPPEDLNYEDSEDEESASCSIRNAFGTTVSNDLAILRRSLEQEPTPANLCLARRNDELDESTKALSNHYEEKRIQEKVRQWKDPSYDIYAEGPSSSRAAQSANKEYQAQMAACAREKIEEKKDEFTCSENNEETCPDQASLSEVRKLIAQRRKEMGIPPKCKSHGVMKKSIEALKSPKRVKRSKACKSRPPAAPTKPLPRYAQPTKASQARALAEKQSQIDAAENAAREIKLGIRYSSHVRGTGLKGKKAVCREVKKDKARKEVCPTKKHGSPSRSQSPHTPARSISARTPPSCGQYMTRPATPDNFEKEYEHDLRFCTPPRRQITEAEVLEQIPKGSKSLSPVAPVLPNLQEKFTAHKERKSRCKRRREEEKQAAHNKMLEQGAIDVDINMALMTSKKATPLCSPEHEHLDSDEMDYYELNDLLLTDAPAPTAPQDLPEDELENVSLQLEPSETEECVDEQEEFEILEQAMQAVKASPPKLVACTPKRRLRKKRGLRRELLRAPRTKRQFKENMLPDLDLVEIRQQQFNRDLNEDAPAPCDETPPGTIAGVCSYVKERIDQLTRRFLRQQNFPNVERMKRLPESIPSPPGIVYEQQEDECQTPPRNATPPYDYVQSRMKHLEKKLLGQRNMPNLERMARMPESVPSPPGAVYNKQVTAAPCRVAKRTKSRTAAQACQQQRCEPAAPSNGCEPKREANEKTATHKRPIPNIVIHPPDATLPCASEDAGTIAVKRLKGKLDAKKRAEEEKQWEQSYIEAINAEIDQKLKCMQSLEKEDDDLGILQPEDMDYTELGNAIGLDIEMPSPHELPQECLEDVSYTSSSISSDDETSDDIFEFENLESIYDPETHLRSEASKLASRYAADCTPVHIAERQQKFMRNMEMAGHKDVQTPNYVQQRMSVLSRKLMNQRNFPIHEQMAKFPKSIPSPPRSICEQRDGALEGVPSPFVKTPPQRRKPCAPSKTKSHSIFGSKRPPPRTASMKSKTELSSKSKSARKSGIPCKRIPNQHGSGKNERQKGLHVNISLSKTSCAKTSPTKFGARKRVMSAPPKSLSTEHRPEVHVTLSDSLISCSKHDSDSETATVQLHITPSMSRLPTVPESDRESTTPKKKRARAATNKQMDFDQYIGTEAAKLANALKDINDITNEILDPEDINSDSMFGEGNYLAPPDDWRSTRRPRDWQQEANAFANRMYQRVQATEEPLLESECEPTYEDLPNQVELEDYERDLQIRIPPRRPITEAEVLEQTPKVWEPLAASSAFPDIKQKFTCHKERKERDRRLRKSEEQKACNEMIEKGAIDVKINMGLMALNEATFTSSPEKQHLDPQEMNYDDLNDLLLANASLPKSPNCLPEEDLENISIQFELSQTGESDSSDDLDEFEVIERAIDAQEIPPFTPERRLRKKRGLRRELMRAPKRRLQFKENMLPDLDVVELRQKQFNRDLNEDAPVPCDETPSNRYVCDNNYVQRRIDHLQRKFMGQQNFPNVERMRRMPESIPSPPGMVYERQEDECQTPSRNETPPFDYVQSRMKHLEKKLLGQRNMPNLERMARMPTTIASPPSDYVQSRIKYLENKLLGQSPQGTICDDDGVPSPFVKTPPRARVSPPEECLSALPPDSVTAGPCPAGKRAKPRTAAQAFPTQRSQAAQAAAIRRQLSARQAAKKTAAKSRKPKVTKTGRANPCSRVQQIKATDRFLRLSMRANTTDCGKIPSRVPQNTNTKIPKCNIMPPTPGGSPQTICDHKQSLYHLQVPQDQRLTPCGNDLVIDINNNEVQYDHQKIAPRTDFDDYMEDDEMFVDDIFGNDAVQQGYTPEQKACFKYAVTRDKLYTIGEDQQHEDLEAVEMEFAPEYTPPHIIQENEDREALTLRLPCPVNISEVTVDTPENMPKYVDTSGISNVREKLKRRAEKAECMRRNAQSRRAEMEEAEKEAFLKRMQMEAADAHTWLQSSSDSGDSIIDLSDASMCLGEAAEPVEPGFENLPNYAPFDEQC